MNWEDERYVRLYTRDTADLMAIGWEGRLVLYELLRHADRAGVIDTGGDLAAMPELLRVPPDVFERGFPRIVARGSVKVLERSLFVPNYHTANEAKQSDKHRQQESRLRRLETARAQGLDPSIAKAAARPDYYQPALVTNRDQTSQNVTIGHGWSHVVTAGHSVPSRAVPCPEEACRAGAPDVPPVKAGSRTRKAMKGPAAEEAELYLEWFNRKMGRAFQVRDAVVRLVARLMAAGHTQGDMRLVAMAAKEDWENDPKMSKYLQPSTLLAMEKFGERLDAAKAAHPEWAERAARGGFANGSSLPTMPGAGGDERGRDREDDDAERASSPPRTATANGVRGGGVPPLLSALARRIGGEGQT